LKKIQRKTSRTGLTRFGFRGVVQAQLVPIWNLRAKWLSSNWPSRRNLPGAAFQWMKDIWVSRKENLPDVYQVCSRKVVTFRSVRKKQFYWLSSEKKRLLRKGHQ